MGMDLGSYAEHDAVGLAELVRAGAVTAAELAETATTAIAAVDDELNAVVECWSAPRAEAAAARPGPLAGVPFLVTDLGPAYGGRRVEQGSTLAAGVRAPADDILATRLTAAGLVPVGRAASPELGVNIETSSVRFGVTRNPWDPARTPGGASGGSAAAVAAGMVPLAHGVDVAGAIRVPAARCGLVGLKPARGRVPAGSHPGAALSGLATALGVARSVRDVAALLDALGAPDRGAPVVVPPPARSYVEAAHADPRRPLRIGIMTSPWGGRTPGPAAVAAVATTAALCAQAGHHVEPTSIDLGMSWEAFVHHSAVLWCAHVAAVVAGLAAATGRPIDLGTLEAQTLAVVRTGWATPAVELLAALDARDATTRAVAATFEAVDVVLSPTTPDVAPYVGTTTAGITVPEDVTGPDWIRRLVEGSPFTPVANTAGLPAISLPLGRDDTTGLPVGVQLLGGPVSEDVLVALAGQLERAAPWHGRHPWVWAGHGD